jgi:hypothetical protein
MRTSAMIRRRWLNAMVSIVPADTGLFRNVVPKAFEEFIKTNQKEAWENNIWFRSEREINGVTEEGCVCNNKSTRDAKDDIPGG